MFPQFLSPASQPAVLSVRLAPGHEQSEHTSAVSGSTRNLSHSLDIFQLISQRLFSVRSLAVKCGSQHTIGTVRSIGTATVPLPSWRCRVALSGRTPRYTPLTRDSMTGRDKVAPPGNFKCPLLIEYIDRCTLTYIVIHCAISVRTSAYVAISFPKCVNNC